MMFSFFVRAQWLRGLFLTGCLGLMSCRGGEPYPDILPIGLVQGEVTPDMEATSLRTPFLGETVRVRGVLHQILRWRTSEGRSVYGILIQNSVADADDNPASSDGMFLYTGAYPSLPLEGEGEYTAKVGDRIIVRGTVEERYGQTELSDARVIEVEQGEFLDTLEVTELTVLPESERKLGQLWERLEGMRVRLPAGAVAVSGSHPNNRNGDMNLWTVLPSHPIAEREESETRRLFRPVHPLGTDAVGARMMLGHLGARERLEKSSTHAMPMVHAGSVITSPLTGGVTYTWGDYVVQPDHLPELEDAGPAASSLPEEKKGVRVAAYNVENLYDFQNDPFDGCDFAGDEGCPDVRKPFNYVPVSDERYRQRIRAIAAQIVKQLDSPDILLIQEVEDQDIGVLTETGMVYGTSNNADGELDALQELAVQIVALGGPVYQTAIDRDGADTRGITCAWMYNADTVRPAGGERLHPLLSPDPELPGGVSWLAMSRDASNPKAFNAEFRGVDSGDALTRVFSRATQLMQFERVSDGQTLFVFNNHFSSGPDRRVERRTMQARVNAMLASALMKSDPGAWVIVGGDLNVFPRPDDPLDPPSDQLGPLYRAGLFNVYDQVVEDRPAEAYSYLYKGVVNTLDHFFLSPSAREAVSYAGYLKLNASAPETFSWQKPLRASDHDPVVVELK
jgi:predicted extracellular nuclease